MTPRLERPDDHNGSCWEANSRLQRSFIVSSSVLWGWSRKPGTSRQKQSHDSLPGGTSGRPVGDGFKEMPHRPPTSHVLGGSQGLCKTWIICDSSLYLRDKFAVDGKFTRQGHQDAVAGRYQWKVRMDTGRWVTAGKWRTLLYNFLGYGTENIPIINRWRFLFFKLGLTECPGQVHMIGVKAFLS